MADNKRSDEIFRTVADLPPGELAAFLAVAHYGGFRAAARTLAQSASALSHAVAGLERRLNVQLFHRSTRAVSLTDAGQRFRVRLSPAYGEIARAVEELRDLSASPSGLVRINTDATAAEQVLLPLVTDFLASHSKMQIEIVTERGLIDIAEGGFDCGVRLAELVPEDMVSIPIGSPQQHIVVASKEYLEAAPDLIQPSDLISHRCIQLRTAFGALYRWEFMRRGEALAVETHGHLIVDHSRLMLEAARRGYGLAYVTRWMARDFLADGSLVQRLAEWTPPYPGLCLYYPRHRHMSTGMRAFTAFLRDL